MCIYEFRSTMFALHMVCIDYNIVQGG